MKLHIFLPDRNERIGVNLPRWGLKLVRSVNAYLPDKCKFTPLGFETVGFIKLLKLPFCVNLPRWGLKLPRGGIRMMSINSVNLPRWGLKHVRVYERAKQKQV